MDTRHFDSLADFLGLSPEDLAYGLTTIGEALDVLAVDLDTTTPALLELFGPVVLATGVQLAVRDRDRGQALSFETAVNEALNVVREEVTE